MICTQELGLLNHLLLLVILRKLTIQDMEDMAHINRYDKNLGYSFTFCPISSYRKDTYIVPKSYVILFLISVQKVCPPIWSIEYYVCHVFFNQNSFLGSFSYTDLAPVVFILFFFFSFSFSFFSFSCSPMSHFDRHSIFNLFFFSYLSYYDVIAIFIQE